MATVTGADAAPLQAVLVTGGAGFIGSHFVKRLLRCPDVAEVTVLDALTYAGSLKNLGGALDDPKLEFVHASILDQPVVDAVMGRHTAVVHFAAESHVDRSFFHDAAFLSTNVLGTQVLLDAALRHRVRRFVHVSTDEVYGPWLTGAASERDRLAPTVPYAASKAASDLVALSYARTYGAPVCVTRSSNNYGPAQHPEKIIPLFITSLLKGQDVALHGDGKHVRNWLHVQDNCAGIELVLRAGRPGEIYNLSDGIDLTNNELTRILLQLCGAGWDRVRYVPDRTANDLRYAMDCAKAREELGYRPTHDLETALAETVEWYRSRPDRWAPALRDPAAPLPRILPGGPEQREAI
ncbi:MAG TPA: dTDP-glucose 4,6-dehydratase [Actinocrinis sp.]|uniref:dTDP-glucose 4,6-dehydratase n=1 Tax=Actinocrinis sp. TaxID=1920516 RepID=UPI002D42B53E|nr:dTDP-glucose 4,6-dehydratase [Actinocrinis sp.]HZU55677.1 dTDP-glucose 4,6-dehydratase [Actinocrinis sp.]